MEAIKVSNIREKFDLEILTGEERINESRITTLDIHRPGLELTGYLDFFSSDRIQVFGKQEITYLLSLELTKQREKIDTYFKMKPPCVVVTRGLPVTDEIIELANKYGVPVLRTNEKTTDFISLLYNHLQKQLATETGIHGVCVSVFGAGILIKGSSGIGKSELALTLIERGHRLISDDLVILKKIGPVALIGTHNEVNQEFLSLRGIGIVNVPRLYGAGAIQNETKIDLEMVLTPWEEGVYYDAVGKEEKRSEYLGIEVPRLEIPIRPGRDMASLVEVAAKNWRLKQQGYNAVDDFYKRLKK